MLNDFTKFYKIEKKQHKIMFNTFSWWARYWNKAQEMNWGRRAEQFPTLEIML